MREQCKITVPTENFDLILLKWGLIWSSCSGDCGSICTFQTQYISLIPWQVGGHWQHQLHCNVGKQIYMMCLPYAYRLSIATEHQAWYWLGTLLNRFNWNILCSTQCILCRYLLLIKSRKISTKNILLGTIQISKIFGWTTLPFTHIEFFYNMILIAT